MENLNKNEKLLIEVLELSWDQIKHAESCRNTLLTIYAIIATAVISVIPIFGLSVESIILLLFLAFFSFSIYFSFIKLNMACIERWVVIHWISEKLGLIKKMEDEDKQHLTQQLKELGIKEIPKYGFFKNSYIALPLPLRIRIHRWLFTYFPNLLASSTFSVAIGVFIYLMSRTFLTGFYLIIPWIIGLVIFFGTFYYCHHFAKKIEHQAYIFLKTRKPKEIETWEIGSEKI